MSGGFCVCPPHCTRRECMAVRYGANNTDEACECACHDADDEEEHEFYASQLSDSTQNDAPYLLPDASEDDDETCDFGPEDVVT